MKPFELGFQRDYLCNSLFNLQYVLYSLDQGPDTPVAYDIRYKGMNYVGNQFHSMLI
jgi:hypothetical protein